MEDLETMFAPLILKITKENTTNRETEQIQANLCIA